MIWSLYTRTVLTFLGIVLLSSITAFMFAVVINNRDLETQVQSDLTVKIDRIADFYNHYHTEDLAVMIREASKLQELSIAAVNEEGEWLYSDQSAEPLSDAISMQQIASVFHDQTVIIDRSEGHIFLKGRVPIIAGKSIQIGNEPWAFFVQPNSQPQMQIFIRTSITILWTVLFVGSCLILVAARYMVQPLKLMTTATRRISRGDFKVELPLKRRDEIGDLAGSFNHMAIELQKLEHMRQDFVSNVSHEIRSPLTSISGFAEVLKGHEITDEEKERYLSVIIRESNRLSRLGQDLLRLASLESDHHPFSPRRFSLSRQIRDVVIACEPLWLAKEIEIELPDEETSIVADEDQLFQVWMNLIMNSIKFTPKGGKITIGLSRSLDTTILSVTDNGIGISYKDRERVFERFYKADSSRSSKEGSGLGLAIVKKIVEIHQGEINIESQLNKGTRITIKLPSL